MLAEEAAGAASFGLSASSMVVCTGAYGLRTGAVSALGLACTTVEVEVVATSEDGACEADCSACGEVTVTTAACDAGEAAAGADRSSAGVARAGCTGVACTEGVSTSADAAGCCWSGFAAWAAAGGAALAGAEGCCGLLVAALLVTGDATAGAGATAAATGAVPAAGATAAAGADTPGAGAAIGAGVADAC